MPPRLVRILVLGLIGLGLAFVALFGYRAIHAFREFRGHPARPPGPLLEPPALASDVELIRDWMTIPFIARMYGIHASELYEALEISPRGNEEKSLTQLNSEFYPQAPGLVRIRIKAAILESLSDESAPPTAPLP